MSNYTKSTDFASKDALASGNSGKVVKGTEIDTEFNNIATAVATKADTAGPTFTGTVTVATLAATTISGGTISGGTITGITDLAVADGGTGASTAANARSNLGTVADTASNGIAARTAANTLTARTITAGTGVSISNGDGVSGNPTITNSGVVSLVAGNGISVSGSTGTVTVTNTTPISGTALAYNWNSLTTNTYLDFTNIPSWVKRITIMLSAISTNGSSSKLIQLIYGTSTVVTSGYRSSSARFNSTNVGESASSTGFILNSVSSGDDLYGNFVLTNLSGDNWVGFGGTTYAAGNLVGSGGVTLSGTLTGVRITTTNGTDTFDAGTVNIFYE